MGLLKLDTSLDNICFLVDQFAQLYRWWRWLRKHFFFCSFSRPLPTRKSLGPAMSWKPEQILRVLSQASKRFKNRSWNKQAATNGMRVPSQHPACARIAASGAERSATSVLPGPGVGVYERHCSVEMQIILLAWGLFNVRQNLDIRCPRLNVPCGRQCVRAKFTSPTLPKSLEGDWTCNLELGRPTCNQPSRWGQLPVTRKAVVVSISQFTSKVFCMAILRKLKPDFTTQTRTTWQKERNTL